MFWCYVFKAFSTFVELTLFFFCPGIYPEFGIVFHVFFQGRFLLFVNWLVLVLSLKWVAFSLGSAYFWKKL